MLRTIIRQDQTFAWLGVDLPIQWIVTPQKKIQTPYFKQIQNCYMNRTFAKNVVTPKSNFDP